MATTPAPGMFIWMRGAHLGEAVRVSREAAKMTQTDLAGRAGTSRKFIYMLEQGKDTLRADKVLKVLLVLGLVPVILPAQALGPLVR